MYQSTYRMETRYYRLQPGDNTMYVFSIAWPSGTKGSLPPYGYRVDRKNKRYDTGIAPCDVVPGMDPQYILVTIMMTHWQGSYVTHISSLRDLRGHHVCYMASHMGAESQGQMYTVAAVLLAAGVLALEPNALHEACDAMLKAPEVLHEIYG